VFHLPLLIEEKCEGLSRCARLCWSVAKIFSAPAAIAAGFLLFAASRAPAFEDTTPALRLTIAGDSTVASYPPESPVHGWGEFIQRRMRRRVQVRNVAVGGASSSSFLAEGRWDAALNERPTVVLIQFGHNDHTQAISLERYAANLQRMIESARQVGAFPILVTPMQLRFFRDGKFVPSMLDYSDVMRQVATQSGVVVLELNDLSGQLYTRLGPARVEQLGSPGNDHTHFNRLGAEAMAGIVLHELSQMRTPLTREILAPLATAPSTGIPKPEKPAKAARRMR
jgi:lysophospholipase L1-like esterase